MHETSHAPSARTRGRHRRTPLRSEPATEVPVLAFEGVTARAGNGRTLLDDVTFAVQRGWLVAVVGPTGAGKTSLARALTGALALRSGRIRLDGVDLADEAARRRRIAYVPQDDVLHGSLGLARTVEYAASLREPRGTDRHDRRARVAAALAELGLEQHADVPVHALSGGQRKRANVAAELVGGPDVIVLDEPTSGLDPGYEKSVLANLRELADRGRTVIAITHSVAAIEQCDRVLYLAAGGKVAYFGPPQRASGYFGQADTADVFLALDGGPEADGPDWKARFRAHPAYARYVQPVVDATSRVTDRPAGVPHPARWIHQYGSLVRRHVDLLRADRRHLTLLLAQGPLLGILLWLVLQPDSLRVVTGTATPHPAAETVAMFLALSVTWLGASNAVREIVKERHIVRREVDAGMAPSAYVLSKATVLGALTMLQTMVLATVAGLGQHPPATGAVLSTGRLELAVAGAAVGAVAMALGLLLSSLVTSPDKALALLPMTLVTELALAGAWADDLSTPLLQQLRNLTGARWGVDAITATVSGDRGAWIGAITVLAALAIASLATTIGFVRRQTRPAVEHPGLAERAGRTVTAARRNADTVLGAAAACCILVAIGAVVHLAGADEATPEQFVAAPVEQAPMPPVAAPAEVVVDAPVEPTPEATTTTAPVVEPVATPTTAAPTTTTTVAPTTTTTYYTPATSAPSQAPVQAATADASNPWATAWSSWFGLWFDMATWALGG